jgi:hypothetical protein
MCKEILLTGVREQTRVITWIYVMTRREVMRHNGNDSSHQDVSQTEAILGCKLKQKGSYRKRVQYGE